MTIEVIDSMEGLAQLRPEWRALYLSCPRATPFQSPEWLLPWMRHLFGGGEIWALAMREGGRLTGFAPLFCWGIGQRNVSFLGAGISDYGDLLFAPGCEAECADAVWCFLQDRHERWDVLDLQELRGDSALLAKGETEACSVCPVLRLDSYPGSMDPKHRIDVRRAKNKLAKIAEVRCATADSDNFDWAIAEYFRLHELRWGALDRTIREFQRETAGEFLKTGALRLCTLQTGGATAAAIFAFTAGQTLYCYLSGFDPSLAKLSPGAVLLGWLVEQAIAEGMKEVDFLRKPEAYKYLWGARDRVNYRLREPRL